VIRSPAHCGICAATNRCTSATSISGASRSSPFSVRPSSATVAAHANGLLEAREEVRSTMALWEWIDYLTAILE